MLGLFGWAKLACWSSGAHTAPQAEALELAAGLLGRPEVLAHPTAAGQLVDALLQLASTLQRAELLAGAPRGGCLLRLRDGPASTCQLMSGGAKL